MLWGDECVGRGGLKGLMWGDKDWGHRCVGKGAVGGLVCVWGEGTAETGVGRRATGGTGGEREVLGELMCEERVSRWTGIWGEGILGALVQGSRGTGVWKVLLCRERGDWGVERVVSRGTGVWGEGVLEGTGVRGLVGGSGVSGRGYWGSCVYWYV